MSKYGKIYNNINYVNLNSLPDPKTEYVLTFENLIGGMNLRDLDFELKPNESPLIRNLVWQDGALCSRRGQVQVGSLGRSTVLRSYARLWHGWMVVHAGICLVAWKAEIESDPEAEAPIGTAHILYDYLERVPGDFARYDQYLFYKTRGSYIRIAYLPESDSFTVRPIQDTPGLVYIPIVQMNTDPSTGAGDPYQPENRLSGFKRVLYSGQTDVSVYTLPVDDADSVYSVKVNGVTWSRGDRWSFEQGKVVFQLSAAPPAGINNVEIMYYKANADAYNSIMSCSRMAVFGGAQELCIVLGGCEAQPNAYFWSGNTHAAMDPTYFPMSHYNLAGDAADAITGFGKQQNFLVIFQPRSVGRAVMGTEEIGGRTQITMDYTRINSDLGCDLPRTIQLVENNLVWCSRKHGVCLLKDSSAAYENNILRLSAKIDGSSGQPGLLELLQDADPDSFWSADTGAKYLIGSGEKAWEWNYSISSREDPSWFSHTGIRGAAFVAELDRLWEITPEGTVAEFQRCYADFGAGIEKVCVLPPRNFGSCDRLKNIRSMLFTTRGGHTTNTGIEYTCDYGSRTDPTPLVCRQSYRVSPRNLAYRDLSRHEFAFVARRRPGYHNIRHLRVKLSNSDAGADLSLISAQIFYTFRARQR